MNLKILPMSHLRGMSENRNQRYLWDCGLREIIEQIIGQHLNRRIGRKGRNKLAPSTLNMFPKLELARHLDVLGNVAEYFATLDDAAL